MLARGHVGVLLLFLFLAVLAHDVGAQTVTELSPARTGVRQEASITAVGLAPGASVRLGFQLDAHPRNCTTLAKDIPYVAPSASLGAMGEGVYLVCVSTDAGASWALQANVTFVVYGNHVFTAMQPEAVATGQTPGLFPVGLLAPGAATRIAFVAQGESCLSSFLHVGTTAFVADGTPMGSAITTPGIYSVCYTEISGLDWYTQVDVSLFVFGPTSITAFSPQRLPVHLTGAPIRVSGAVRESPDTLIALASVFGLCTVSGDRVGTTAYTASGVPMASALDTIGTYQVCLSGDGGSTWFAQVSPATFTVVLDITRQITRVVRDRMMAGEIMGVHAEGVEESPTTRLAFATMGSNCTDVVAEVDLSVAPYVLDTVFPLWVAGRVETCYTELNVTLHLQSLVDVTAVGPRTVTALSPPSVAHGRFGVVIELTGAYYNSSVAFTAVGGDCGNAADRFNEVFNTAAYNAPVATYPMPSPFIIAGTPRFDVCYHEWGGVWFKEELVSVRMFGPATVTALEPSRISVGVSEVVRAEGALVGPTTFIAFTPAVVNNCDFLRFAETAVTAESVVMGSVLADDTEFSVCLTEDSRITWFVQDAPLVTTFSDGVVTAIEPQYISLDVPGVPISLEGVPQGVRATIAVAHLGDDCTDPADRFAVTTYDLLAQLDAAIGALNFTRVVEGVNGTLYEEQCSINHTEKTYTQGEGWSAVVQACGQTQSVSATHVPINGTLTVESDHVLCYSENGVTFFEQTPRIHVVGQYTITSLDPDRLSNGEVATISMPGAIEGALVALVPLGTDCVAEAPTFAESITYRNGGAVMPTVIEEPGLYGVCLSINNGTTWFTQLNAAATFQVWNATDLVHRFSPARLGRGQLSTFNISGAVPSAQTWFALTPEHASCDTYRTSATALPTSSLATLSVAVDGSGWWKLCYSESSSNGADGVWFEQVHAGRIFLYSEDTVRAITPLHLLSNTKAPLTLEGAFAAPNVKVAFILNDGTRSCDRAEDRRGQTTYLGPGTELGESIVQLGSFYVCYTEDEAAGWFEQSVYLPILTVSVCLPQCDGTHCGYNGCDARCECTGGLQCAWDGECVANTVEVDCDDTTEHCYAVLDGATSWEEARWAALHAPNWRNMHSHLSVVNTAAELAYVRTDVPINGTATYVGGQRSRNDPLAWQWETTLGAQGVTFFDDGECYGEVCPWNTGEPAEDGRVLSMVRVVETECNLHNVTTFFNVTELVEEIQQHTELRNVTVLHVNNATGESAWVNVTQWVTFDVAVFVNRSVEYSNTTEQLFCADVRQPTRWSSAHERALDQYLVEYSLNEQDVYEQLYMTLDEPPIRDEGVAAQSVQLMGTDVLPEEFDCYFQHCVQFGLASQANSLDTVTYLNVTTFDHRTGLFEMTVSFAVRTFVEYASLLQTYVGGAEAGLYLGIGSFCSRNVTCVTVNERRLVFGVQTETSFVGMTHDIEVADGQWHVVTAVFRGSNAGTVDAAMMSLTIDSTTDVGQVDTAIVVGAPIPMPLRAGGHALIGFDPMRTTDEDTTMFSFVGYLDNVSIFGRALDPLIFGGSLTFPIAVREVLNEIVLLNPAAPVFESWHLHGQATASDWCSGSWKGITCDGFDIVGLDLAHQGLVGEFPFSLATLSRITMIDLRGNALTSVPTTLPATIKIGLVGDNDMVCPIPEEWVEAGTNPYDCTFPDTQGALYELKQIDSSNQLPEWVFWPWPEAATYCAWPEVVCNDAMEVSELHVALSLLQGEIPASLGKLLSLEVLDMSRNAGLVGVVPDVFESDVLRDVNLSYTGLAGDLPIGMLTKSSMREARMSHAGFTTAAHHFRIPHNITVLDLSHNALVGVLPRVETGYNSTLLELDLSYNNIGGSIAREWPLTLLDVRRVDLSHNVLTGMLPYEFAAWSRLESLRLAGNLLEGELLRGLFLLPVLHTLDVSGNALSGFLPAEVALVAQPMFQLNVSGNTMHGHVPLPGNATFASVDLAHNRFYCPLPEEWVAFGVDPLLCCTRREGECGDNACLGSLGNCTLPDRCVSTFSCCTPRLGECGDDGCEGVLGNCSQLYSVNSICVQANNTCTCDDGSFGPNCTRCHATFFGHACDPCQYACQHGHGCRDTEHGDGSCMCDLGWDGYFCDTCAEGWVAETDCTTCEPGYFGANCTHCPPCVHGVCDDLYNGTGVCICDFPFTGPLCTECEPGYFGVNCTQCQDCNNGDCNDGASNDGSCLCHTGWDGAVCLSCDTGYFSDKCNQTCPGGPTNMCYGNGVCDHGRNASGLCTCDAGFWGFDCQSPCLCANGVCEDGSTGAGTCSCFSGYWGVQCSGVCLGGAEVPCSGHGVCADGATNLGTCTCNPGFFGDDCSQGCECGAHGTCNDGDGGDGTCSCDAGWWGTSCTFECIGGGAANPCTGKGTCRDGSLGDGSCNCNPGQYGTICNSTCTCVFGTCNDGDTGDGSCDCRGRFWGEQCENLGPRLDSVSPQSGYPLSGVRVTMSGQHFGPSEVELRRAWIDGFLCVEVEKIAGEDAMVCELVVETDTLPSGEERSVRFEVNGAFSDLDAVWTWIDLPDPPIQPNEPSLPLDEDVGDTWIMLRWDPDFAEDNVVIDAWDLEVRYANIEDDPNARKRSWWRGAVPAAVEAGGATGDAVRQVVPGAWWIAYSGNVNSFNLTNLEPLTPYEFRIRAYNAGGHSEYSPIRSIETKRTVRPTTVNEVLALALGIPIGVSFLLLVSYLTVRHHHAKHMLKRRAAKREEQARVDQEQHDLYMSLFETVNEDKVKEERRRTRQREKLSSMDAMTPTKGSTSPSVMGTPHSQRSASILGQIRESGVPGMPSLRGTPRQQRRASALKAANERRASLGGSRRGSLGTPRTPRTPRSVGPHDAPLSATSERLDTHRSMSTHGDTDEHDVLAAGSAGTVATVHRAKPFDAQFTVSKQKELTLLRKYTDHCGILPMDATFQQRLFFWMTAAYKLSQLREEANGVEAHGERGTARRMLKYIDWRYLYQSAEAQGIDEHDWAEWIEAHGDEVSTFTGKEALGVTDIHTQIGEKRVGAVYDDVSEDSLRALFFYMSEAVRQSMYSHHVTAPKVDEPATWDWEDLYERLRTGTSLAPDKWLTWLSVMVMRGGAGPETPVQRPRELWTPRGSRKVVAAEGGGSFEDGAIPVPGAANRSALEMVEELDTARLFDEPTGEDVIPRPPSPVPGDPGVEPLPAQPGDSSITEEDFGYALEVLADLTECEVLSSSPRVEVLRKKFFEGDTMQQFRMYVTLPRTRPDRVFDMLDDHDARLGWDSLFKQIEVVREVRGPTWDGMKHHVVRAVLKAPGKQRNKEFVMYNHVRVDPRGEMYISVYKSATAVAPRKSYWNERGDVLYGTYVVRRDPENAKNTQLMVLFSVDFRKLLRGKVMQHFVDRGGEKWVTSLLDAYKRLYRGPIQFMSVLSRRVRAANAWLSINRHREDIMKWEDDVKAYNKAREQRIEEAMHPPGETMEDLEQELRSRVRTPRMTPGATPRSPATTMTSGHASPHMGALDLNDTTATATPPMRPADARDVVFSYRGDMGHAAPQHPQQHAQQQHAQQSWASMPNEEHLEWAGGEAYDDGYDEDYRGGGEEYREQYREDYRQDAREGRAGGGTGDYGGEEEYRQSWREGEAPLWDGGAHSGGHEGAATWAAAEQPRGAAWDEGNDVYGASYDAPYGDGGGAPQWGGAHHHV